MKERLVRSLANWTSAAAVLTAFIVVYTTKFSMSVVRSAAMSLVLFQQLLMVSMVTGAVFSDSCTIDDTLPSAPSLTLSTTGSRYQSGQSVTGSSHLCP